MQLENANGEEGQEGGKSICKLKNLPYDSVFRLLRDPQTTFRLLGLADQTSLQIADSGPQFAAVEVERQNGRFVPKAGAKITSITMTETVIVEQRFMARDFRSARRNAPLELPRPPRESVSNRIRYAFTRWMESLE